MADLNHIDIISLCCLNIIIEFGIVSSSLNTINPQRTQKFVSGNQLLLLEASFRSEVINDLNRKTEVFKDIFCQLLEFLVFNSKLLDAIRCCSSLCGWFGARIDHIFYLRLIFIFVTGITIFIFLLTGLASFLLLLLLLLHLLQVIWILRHHQWLKLIHLICVDFNIGAECITNFEIEWSQQDLVYRILLFPQ